ncbi:cyclic nucleotide-binding domain-containing protein [Streptomyces sp. NPDC048623]|uniref:Crp/Fnr family transcriptional regulator n=1 Tax=Streptomyces sp. NPDC048623 TaxID=3155761 RepID=UPI003415EB4A
MRSSVSSVRSSAQTPPRITTALAPEYRGLLMKYAQRRDFEPGERLFTEGGAADRFWIVRTGTVLLDAEVPGGTHAVVDRADAGEPVGCSWLFAPYRWQLGAEAMTPVRADEFDAATVRMLMDADPAFGSALGHFVGRVLAHRLRSARIRLLDRYAPHGSGL